ncbi:hypothetical protein BC332_29326 [Capsicum chinense]|nr:hypothetical protein BC332_29326 [Capsicum chinense]
MMVICSLSRVVSKQVDSGTTVDYEKMMMICFSFSFKICQTTSKRVAERKVAKFEKNITRRGLNITGKNKMEPAHIVLALFAVLVIGSFIFQVVKMAINGGNNED